MSRTAAKGSFRDMPRTYEGLVARLAPRPIHDDVDLANTTEMIDRLAGFALNGDQEDYLEALSTFVEAYERDRFPIDDSRMTPMQALRFILAENGMTASDLGRLLGSRTLGPAILSGRRGLSKTHISKLAERFKVSPGLFL